MHCHSHSIYCARAPLIMLLSGLLWTGNPATLVWINPAGGNWSDAANWDPVGVPGPGDIAKITTAGNYTVTDDLPTTMVGAIIVGNALPATGVQGFLVPAGVTLTTTAAITVNDNGTFTVDNGGTVELANTSPLHFVGVGTNYWIIVLTNSSIYLYNDGTSDNQGGFVNESGGLLLLDGSGGIISALRPNDYFQNRGLVSKTAGTGTSSITASVGVLGGAYTGAEGTTIQLGGGTASAPLEADRSLFLLGFAQMQFASGFLRFPTNVIPNLDLRGGTLQLEPDFQGGTITNLTLDGIDLTNTLPVTGTLTMTNGSVNGVVPVANGGLLSAFNATVNAQTTVEAGGRFMVESGTASLGNGFVSNVWITVMNGGSLDIAGLLTLNGPLTNSGTINVTNGTSVQAFNNGTAHFAGGLVNLASGVIGLWNNSSLDGAARGNEYLLNQGAINKMSGTAQSTIDFSFLYNAGILTAQHGTLLLQSPHGSLQSSQTLGVTLNSASDYGKLSIVGAAPLTGFLSVSLGNGYVPSIGATFTVFSYGSLSSGFTGFHYPAVPAAAVWQPTYGATALTLQMQSAVARVAPGTRLATRVDGLPGRQAILLTSTDVASPLVNWVPLSTNTFDLTGYLSLTNNLVPTESQRFFSFKLP